VNGASQNKNLSNRLIMNTLIKKEPSQTAGAIATRKHIDLMESAGLKRMVSWIRPERRDEFKQNAKKYRRPISDD
jgi:hypothetical protein